MGSNISARSNYPQLALYAVLLFRGPCFDLLFLWQINSCGHNSEFDNFCSLSSPVRLNFILTVRTALLHVVSVTILYVFSDECFRVARGERLAHTLRRFSEQSSTHLDPGWVFWQRQGEFQMLSEENSPLIIPLPYPTLQSTVMRNTVQRSH